MLKVQRIDVNKSKFYGNSSIFGSTIFLKRNSFLFKDISFFLRIFIQFYKKLSKDYRLKFLTFFFKKSFDSLFLKKKKNTQTRYYFCFISSGLNLSLSTLFDGFALNLKGCHVV